jgi:hypothetical protein
VEYNRLGDSYVNDTGPFDASKLGDYWPSEVRAETQKWERPDWLDVHFNYDITDEYAMTGREKAAWILVIIGLALFWGAVMWILFAFVKVQS